MAILGWILLVAQADSTESGWDMLLRSLADRPEILVALAGVFVGLVAVAGGISFVIVVVVLHHKTRSVITAREIEHRERMEMIRQGIHPDDPRR